MRTMHLTPIGRALYLAGLAGLLLPVPAAIAAQAPDAGRTLQETTPALESPRVSPGISIESPSPAEMLPGGASVTLQSVVFGGNSLYDETVLKAVLGDVAGKSYDLAGLKGLANQITTHYRANGYPFARAYIPAQPLTDGNLRIEVVEGRYGKIEARGDATFKPHAERFLSHLQPGQVIESTALERATLILDDQPGIKVVPIIRPGQQVGTGDLDVNVERDGHAGGEIGLDNAGNRYAGRNRLRASMHIDSPFMLGDQISASGLYTEGGMWNGNVAYALPLGSDGLRANIGYAQTYYELGKEFTNLNAYGNAKVASMGLSYPVIRSQKANVMLSATYQHKALQDTQGAANTRNDKRSESLPLALQFDLRDGLGWGGITYGAFSWTHGNLNLDSVLKAADQLTANTAGNFDKLNLDLARLQALPASFTLYGRVSAQWAGGNLDSSEGFGLGGSSGVRAYPSGEAYGDEGWLTQIELRYTSTMANSASLSPYAFYDSGRVRINHNPWTAGANHRSIGGAGLGVRADYRQFIADAGVAWRSHGGVPQSDSKNENPVILVSAGYRF